MPVNFSRLFEPKSLAVIGASELKGAGAAFSNEFRILAENAQKLKKKIYIADINQKLPGAIKLGKIPKGIDLAVVALPKELLSKNLGKILTKKVGTLVLTEEEVDAKVEKLLAKKKVTILGAGSFGVMNPKAGLAVVPESIPSIRPGGISVISGGRASTINIIGRAKSWGIGIAKLASAGDGLWIDQAELIHHLASDKETRVICIFIDDVKDGRMLMSAVKGASVKKPVVVMKCGPPDKVFEGAITQSGGILAESFGDMLGGAVALEKFSGMSATRVALVAALEEEAKLVAGQMLKEGLELAKPSEETFKKISNKCRGAKMEGWVCLGSAADADDYKNAIKEVLSDDSVDGVMVACSGTVALAPGDYSKIAEDAGKSKEKPVVMVVDVRSGAVARESLGEKSAPIFWSERLAAIALKMLKLRRDIVELRGMAAE
ncbi:MAG: hypothetical protein AB1305_04125 [Candidatus Hadarchaeota archaeon]